MRSFDKKLEILPLVGGGSHRVAQRLLADGSGLSSLGRLGSGLQVGQRRSLLLLLLLLLLLAKPAGCLRALRSQVLLQQLLLGGGGAARVQPVLQALEALGGGPTLLLQVRWQAALQALQRVRRGAAAQTALEALGQPRHAAKHVGGAGGGRARDARTQD